MQDQGWTLAIKDYGHAQASREGVSSLHENHKGDADKVWEKNSMAERRCGNQGGHPVFPATYLYQLQPEPNVEQTSIWMGCANLQELPCTEKNLLSQALLSFNSKKTAGNYRGVYVYIKAHQK